ncbi:MAG: hypothetical protein ACI360_04880 [Atopobiaceae bacterium]
MSQQDTKDSTQSNQDGQVIESASATTSPDNAHSGNTAYIITVVALAVVIALGMGLSGCISSLSTTALKHALSDYEGQSQQGLGSSGSSQYGYGYGYGNGSSSGSTSGSLSVQDSLQLNLSVYGETIDSNVSASDYSGVSDDVRTYARSIIKLDTAQNQEVVSHLDAAANASDPRSDIEAAISVCDDTLSQLQSIAVPSGTDGTTIATDAQDSMQAAQKRWTALKAELQLLDTTDDVSMTQLEKADQQVEQATQDASSAITTMLADSASNQR